MEDGLAKHSLAEVMGKVVCLLDRAGARMVVHGCTRSSAPRNLRARHPNAPESFITS